MIVSAAAEAGLVAGAAPGDAPTATRRVRLEAVRAAGALERPPALDIVRGAVDDRSNAVRAEATRILPGGSGAGAQEVLPIFEAMLRGGDKAAREAAVIGVGELPGAGEAGARLLGEALAQRSEALRTAAARALGQLAEREPDGRAAVSGTRRARSVYDVRSAGHPRPGAGLVAAAARAAELGRALVDLRGRQHRAASSRWRRW